MTDRPEPTADRRRSPRTEVDLRVEASVDGEAAARIARAIDINEHGVFVATPDAPDLHRGVTLAVSLGGGAHVCLRGQIVRRLLTGRIAPGETAGFGVQLAVDSPDLAVWTAFCQEVARRRTPLPERRRFERVALRLQVHVRAASEAGLRAFVTQNLSAAGARFETDAELPVGARLELVFHDPETGEAIALRGEVVRSESAPAGRSVAVRFDAPEWDAFERLNRR